MTDNKYYLLNSANDDLFMAIMKNDPDKIRELKSGGAVLSDRVKTALITGGGELGMDPEYSDIWRGFGACLFEMDVKQYCSVLRNIRAELDEPIYCGTALYSGWGERLYKPDIFGCVLDCFDNKKIPKKPNLQSIIDLDKPELLAIAEEHGWLKAPKKRDELIRYAAEKGSTECTAWLLEFKNRTADLAAEREKAEKKMQRELNAAPDSVYMLKQLWSYKKRGDGAVIITGYRGRGTEITVPAKIGKSEVKEIAQSAFSPFAKRLTDEQRKVRETITKITLPESVDKIGCEAFFRCESLRTVNIPDGVSKIREETFWGCRSLEKMTIPGSVTVIEISAFSGCETLEKIVIPEGVVDIGTMAFGGCYKLTEAYLPRSFERVILRPSGIDLPIFGGSPGVVAFVPRDSFAADYCREHEIRFTYKEDSLK